MQTILAIFCNLIFHGRSFAILKGALVAPDAIFIFSEILRQRLWPMSVSGGGRVGENVELALRIFITKFGDSQKSSLNLVKEFAQYFPLVLFLKKIHQNGHDICHQIW